MDLNATPPPSDIVDSREFPGKQSGAWIDSSGFESPPRAFDKQGTPTSTPSEASPTRSPAASSHEYILKHSPDTESGIAAVHNAGAEPDLPSAFNNGSSPDASHVQLASTAVDLADKPDPSHSSARSIYAANYHHNVHEFLSCPSLAALSALDRALVKVDARDIDVSEAEALVQQTRGLLNSGRATSVLAACALIVRYQVMKPESAWMASVDTMERAASAFRDVAVAPSALRLRDLAALAEVIDLWTQLVRVNRLEEHHAYPLMTAAVQWIFGLSHAAVPHGQQLEIDLERARVGRRFTEFIAASYEQLPARGREEVVHDLVTAWFKSNDAAETMAQLVLSLVGVAGEIPSRQWDEFKLLRTARLAIEDAAVEKHRHAVVVAATISRRIIDHAHTASKSSDERQEVRRFMRACASLLQDSAWPAAEVFISSFVGSLFRLSRVLTTPKYATFLFDVLGTLMDALYELQENSGTEARNNLNTEDGVGASADESHASSQREPDLVDPALVMRAIAACPNRYQAAYLATRQCTLPGQPVLDFAEAVQQWDASSHAAVHVTVSSQDWQAWLRQFPIAGYYASIVELLSGLATNCSLAERHEIELFRLLHIVVSRDPAHFRESWLTRLSHVAVNVAVAIVPIVTEVVHRCLTAQGVVSVAVIRPLAERSAAPGGAAYKRRVFALLSAVASEATDQDSADMAWTYLLIGAGDPHPPTAEVAAKYTRELFDMMVDRGEGGFDDDVDRRLLQGLLAALRGSSAARAGRGLRAAIHTMRVSGGTVTLQRVVATLLDAGELSEAALILRANGSFMPASRIAAVFEICQSKQTEDPAASLGALQILDAALAARPRLMLAPPLATRMFSALVRRIPSAREVVFEHLAPILAQLVYLGNPTVRQERLAVLERILDRSVAALESTDTRRDDRRFAQLAMILGAGMRWWGHSEGLSRARETALTIIHGVQANGKTGGTVSCVAVRAVFNIASRYPTLFSDASIDGFLGSFTVSGPEAKALTKQLLQFMHSPSQTSVDHTCASGIKTGTNGDADTSGSQKNRIFGVGEDHEAVAAQSKMLQKYLEPVMAQASNGNDPDALRVVVKAVDDSLVVPDRVLAMITALCFSRRPEVAQTALPAFARLCAQWPESAAHKFVAGLRQAAGLPEMQPSATPFAAMFYTLKDNQRQRNVRSVLLQLANVFRQTVSVGQESAALAGEVAVDTAEAAADQLLELVVEALSLAAFEHGDAKYLVTEIEDAVFMYSPDNEGHTSRDSARAIVGYVFALWLRKRYGLSTCSPEPDDTLEPLNTKSVLARFATDGKAGMVLSKLMELPDVYGSPQMQELLSGNPRRAKREAETSLGGKEKRQKDNKSIDI